MPDDDRGPRETVYDEQISPLMTKIIAICKKHGIPMLADFALDGDLQCTTAILVDKDEPPQHFRQAYALLRPAGDFSVAEYDLTIHDTPPVVLSGLVKGGEIRTATEWHAAEADALCVASDGRVCQHFWHYEDAVRRGALPITWYRYEEP